MKHWELFDREHSALNTQSIFTSLKPASWQCCCCSIQADTAKLELTKLADKKAALDFAPGSICPLLDNCLNSAIVQNKGQNTPQFFERWC